MLTPAATYERFASFVRRQLEEMGVREADVSDLCHEVFLVVHGRAEVLSEVHRVDLWLREVSRRVAAGYRRRAGHQREVLGLTPPEQADSGAAIAEEADHGQRMALLRRALDRLDDESRDLLALHDVGEMPLTQLARLVEHDPKTIRTRLTRARRRISRWLEGDGAPEGDNRLDVAPRAPSPASPFMREQAARGRAAGSAANLEVLRVSPEHCSGALGNVNIADWRGPQVGVDVVEAAMAQSPYSLERCGGELAYLALIEPSMRPPPLAARRRIVDALEMVGPFFSAFAVVLLGESAQINRSILAGLTVLTQSPFPIPMSFFRSLDAAAEWLCRDVARGPAGPIAPADLVAAAEHIRRLQGGSP